MKKFNKIEEYLKSIPIPTDLQIKKIKKKIPLISPRLSPLRSLSYRSENLRI